ncbi:MAG TPA: MmgE/PrpD family protein [Xanthobacteraceae bacterium]|nr:MmgE/PrpD family protein [Xanthobacteraceae bacterium]
MLQTPGVTERLAHFVVATQWDDLDAKVVHQAKRSLMNFFAVALTGCRDGTIAAALQTFAVFSGGQQATIVGRCERIDALSAAFLNAASANVLDFCDTHVPTAIHPTAPVVPALLALAEMTPVSGRDFLLALVLGHEVECRIGMAISPSHYKRGWHITSTCGVFGAAVGAGRLLRLSAQQMVWALGIAATQSGGLCECLGTPAKSVSVGNAARNGLLSALLAAKNFDGPAEPLTGAQGYYHALNETADLASLTRNLGETWEILGTAYKPYPCGFVIHPVLDCLLGWRQANPAAVVEKVTVTGNPLLAVRADRPQISTGREAQVSTQHAVAAALIRGRAGVEEFTDACVNDPKIVALRGKVKVLRDETFATTSAAAEIVTADGKTHKVMQHAARGSAENPMSDQDLAGKLALAAKGAIPDNDVMPLIEAIWQLDGAEDISGLAPLTVPRG